MTCPKCKAYLSKAEVEFRLCYACDWGKDGHREGLDVVDPRQTDMFGRHASNVEPVEPYDADDGRVSMRPTRITDPESARDGSYNQKPEETLIQRLHKEAGGLSHITAIGKGKRRRYFAEGGLVRSEVDQLSGIIAITTSPAIGKLITNKQLVRTKCKRDASSSQGICVAVEFAHTVPPEVFERCGPTDGEEAHT